MKSEISSLELHYLVKELKALENTKVDRIYHSKESKSELVIALHLSGIGKKYLDIMLPAKICVLDSKEDQGIPTGLCMMLRKYLEGTILRGISQKGFERALEFTIEAKTGATITKYVLIIELFSKGNIIFCDDKYKILNLLEEQNWKDRILKKDNTYIFPKSKYDVLGIDAKQFTEIIKATAKDSIVKSLAIDLSLGGLYSEELCMLSGIDKKEKAADIDDKRFSILYKNFKALFGNSIKANLASGNILPFELVMFKDEEKKYYETFNDAIINNLDAREDKVKKGKQEQIDKIQNIINEQEQSLKSCEDSYDENQKKAEAIYSHYQEIDEILKTLRKAREKHSWKAIKEIISKNKEFKDKIIDVIEKDNEIIISLK